jgi:hypothetical protein
VQPSKAPHSIRGLGPRLLLDRPITCRSQIVSPLPHNLTFHLSVLLRLPSYEASHEFDKRSRRPPPGPMPIPMGSMNLPPRHPGNHIPTRESFRQGGPPMNPQAQGFRPAPGMNPRYNHPPGMQRGPPPPSGPNMRAHGHGDYQWNAAARPGNLPPRPGMPPREQSGSKPRMPPRN